MYALPFLYNSFSPNFIIKITKQKINTLTKSHTPTHDQIPTNNHSTYKLKIAFFHTWLKK